MKHVKHKMPKHLKAVAFPIAGGLMKELEHPKPDKTSARRGLVRHAQDFKQGGMSDGEFEKHIKNAHDKLSGF